VQSIGLATLYASPRPITGFDGNTSQLWLGDALSAAGDVRLYIKKVTPYELVAECVCAVIGSAVDMPVLPTYLVQDPDNLLNAGLLLGSADADVPSFKRIAQQQGNHIAMAALQSWHSIYEAAIFDELIVNSDRNVGNFLWDGHENWYLIDHGRAFWSLTNTFSPTDIVRNILADLIRVSQNDIGIARMKSKLLAETEKYKTLDANLIKQNSLWPAFKGIQDIDNRLLCLLNRIHHLPYLLARHSAQPGLL